MTSGRVRQEVGPAAWQNRRMKPSSSVRPSVTAVEHGGQKWKPARGCSSTWDEFLAARSLFKELSAESLWNPWIREDRATDMEHAMSVMGQWTRAEPNFRPLSAKRLDAQLARLDRKFEAEHAQTALRQERDATTQEGKQRDCRCSSSAPGSPMNSRSWRGWRTAHASRLWPSQRARPRSPKPASPWPNYEPILIDSANRPATKRTSSMRRAGFHRTDAN